LPGNEKNINILKFYAHNGGMDLESKLGGNMLRNSGTPKIVGIGSLRLAIWEDTNIAIVQRQTKRAHLCYCYYYNHNYNHNYNYYYNHNYNYYYYHEYYYYYHQRNTDNSGTISLHAVRDAAASSTVAEDAYTTHATGAQRRRRIVQRRRRHSSKTPPKHTGDTSITHRLIVHRQEVHVHDAEIVGGKRVQRCATLLQIPTQLPAARIIAHSHQLVPNLRTHDEDAGLASGKSRQ
jgi:hypothetical protein